MAAERWATFDCYGTLIDWNLGIRGELERLFGEDAPRLLERYHEIEPEIEAEPFHSYHEVLTLHSSGSRRRAQPPRAKLPLLPTRCRVGRRSPRSPAALAEARERGWLLAILSNTDRDLIAASKAQLGVPIDLAIVAEELGSYKPAHAHWEQFFEATTADREHHVHVAASLFHDIAPAPDLGLRSVWINRLGEQAEPEPDRELPDLSDLPARSTSWCPHDQRVHNSPGPPR